MNEDGMPFRIVLDNNFETVKVDKIPNKMSIVSINAEKMESAAPPETPMKNMVMMAISVGNLPLQGTKLLVIIAMSRSRGESIIRQPTIPTALHPKPIHIVNACLPQAQHFLNGLSRLYATRGK